MKDKHITHMLDSSSLASLTEHDLQRIRAHVESCESCSRAYEAAQVAALLIKERATESAQNINPFFQTRVLAAWREQQSIARVPAFRRLWNSTGALVASMAATTAALAVLTFVAPSAELNSQPAAALIPNSAEAILLDEQEMDQFTEEQLLSAIYAEDGEGE